MVVVLRVPTGNDCYSRCTAVMYNNNIIMLRTAARDVCTERKPIMCALSEFHSCVRNFTNVFIRFNINNNSKNNNNDDIKVYY